MCNTGSISSLDDLSFSPMGHQLSHQSSDFSEMAAALEGEGGGRSSEVNKPNNHIFALWGFPLPAAANQSLGLSGRHFIRGIQPAFWGIAPGFWVLIPVAFVAGCLSETISGHVFVLGRIAVFGGVVLRKFWQAGSRRQTAIMCFLLGNS